MLAKTIEVLKDRRRQDEPLDYQNAVKKLHNFDTPGTNAVSILITDYSKICKINVAAGISLATQVGGTIIDDVYTRVRHSTDPLDLDWHGKLEILEKRNSGLNQNIVEHLTALMLSSAPKYLSSEKDHKKLIDMSLAAVLSWYSVAVCPVSGDTGSSGSSVGWVVITDSCGSEGSLPWGGAGWLQLASATQSINAKRISAFFKYFSPGCR